MADLASALQTAKQAGYSDKDIADHLATDPGMGAKVAQARQAGYSDSEIVSHLVAAPPAPQSENPFQKAARLTGEAYQDANQAYGRDIKTYADKGIAGQRPSLMEGVAPVLDAVAVATAPIKGVMDATFGDKPLHLPSEIAGVHIPDAVSNFNSRGMTGGDIASFFIPVAGELKAGQEVAAAAKTAGVGQRTMQNALQASRAGQAAAAPVAAASAKPNALQQVAQRVQPIVQQFDQAGVRPSLAAAEGGGASQWANAIAENALAGTKARANMADQVADVQASAKRIGQGYGAAADRTAAGEAVQQGIQDFNQRFSDRANALYEPIFDKINGAFRQAAQAAQSSAPDARVTQRLSDAGFPQPATAPVINPEATTKVLSDINARGDAPALKELFQTPQVRTLTTAVTRDVNALSFQDLRNARTWVRNAQRDPALRQGVSESDLQRLEGALTQDINTNAQALAGPGVARQLQQADTFYRIGAQRIRNGLQAFLGSGGHATAESAYDRIWRAAGNTGGADSARLGQLKASLKPDEWGDVASSVIDRMGAPSNGAANVNEPDSFSLANFVSKYGSLSDRGKALLFGTGDLRGQLDNLAQVAGKVKAVEKGANASNSGVSMQNMKTMQLLANPLTMLPTLGALGGMKLTGRLLTDPAAVRWVANLAKAQASSPAAVSSAIGRLGAATRQNAALVPLYSEALKLVQPDRAAATNDQGSGTQ